MVICSIDDWEISRVFHLSTSTFIVDEERK